MKLGKGNKVVCLMTINFNLNFNLKPPDRVRKRRAFPYGRPKYRCALERSRILSRSGPNFPNESPLSNPLKMRISVEMFFTVRMEVGFHVCGPVDLVVVHVFETGGFP